MWRADTSITAGVYNTGHKIVGLDPVMGHYGLDWQHRDHPPARLACVSVLVSRVCDCLAFLVCRQLRAGDSR